MKAVCIIKAEGHRDCLEFVTVQRALHAGQQAALKLASDGHKNVSIEVYELVAQAPVRTTHVITVEKVTKP